MFRSRSSAVPFTIKSTTIRTLKDLKRALKDNPEDLFTPIKDGRMARFLRGFSKDILDCIDENNPKESLLRLAKALNVDIDDKAMMQMKDVNLVDSESKIMEFIQSGKKEIVIARGIYSLNKLSIDRGIRLIGQGKSETLLKIKELATSATLILENITCEIEKCDCVKEPHGVNSVIEIAKHSNRETKEPSANKPYYDSHYDTESNKIQKVLEKNNEELSKHRNSNNTHQEFIDSELENNSRISKEELLEIKKRIAKVLEEGDYITVHVDWPTGKVIDIERPNKRDEKKKK